MSCDSRRAELCGKLAAASGIPAEMFQQAYVTGKANHKDRTSAGKSLDVLHTRELLHMYRQAGVKLPLHKGQFFPSERSQAGHAAMRRVLQCPICGLFMGLAGCQAPHTQPDTVLPPDRAVAPSVRVGDESDPETALMPVLDTVSVPATPHPDDVQCCDICGSPTHGHRSCLTGRVFWEDLKTVMPYGEVSCTALWTIPQKDRKPDGVGMVLNDHMYCLHPASHTNAAGVTTHDLVVYHGEADDVPVPRMPVPVPLQVDFSESRNTDRYGERTKTYGMILARTDETTVFMAAQQVRIRSNGLPGEVIEVRTHWCVRTD